MHCHVLLVCLLKVALNTGSLWIELDKLICILANLHLSDLFLFICLFFYVNEEDGNIFNTFISAWNVSLFLISSLISMSSEV